MSELVQAGQNYNEYVDLVKRTICKDATDDELKLFLYQCKKTGLDALSKQIHSVKRWNSSTQRNEMSIQTGIDGLRLIAQRTGQYEGQVGPYWCGQDGIWVDVWVSGQSPAAAKVGVWRTGFKEPTWGIARFNTYAQTTKSGELTSFWRKMPELMIAKCAESLALRKAFPQELSDIHIPEELNDDIQIVEASETGTNTTKEIGASQVVPKPEIFSDQNARHMSFIGQFLAKRNDVQSTNAFVARMIGKEFRISVLESEYAELVAGNGAKNV